MTLAATAARGGAITLGSQLLKLVLMLASTVILARLLSPRDYGLVAMVVAIIGVGEIFRDFGLSMAALQAKDLTRGQQSNLFWLNAGVGALLTGLCFGSSFLIAGFYGETELVGIAQVLSWTFLLNGLSTQFKVAINRDLRFATLVLVDLVPYVLAFGAAVWIALATNSYWALVMQQAVVAVVTLVLAVCLARWWPGMPDRAAPMKHLVSFGVSFATTQLLSYATRNVDSIAIGRVWGSTSLGFYDRAYNLLTLPLTQINTPMSRVAVPVLSRLRDEDERFISYLRRAQLVALYVTSTLLWTLVGLGGPLVEFVLGAQWRVAGEILAVLAIGGAFRALAQISYWIFMARGLAGAQLRFYLIAQPLLVVCILLGLPWGVMGVAVAHSIGYALFWAASLFWVGRAAKITVRPLFADAGRAIMWLGLPIAIVAFCATRVAEGLGAALILEVLIGLIAALLWLVLAWLMLSRVRSDIRDLVGFMKLAVQGRK